MVKVVHEAVTDGEIKWQYPTTNILSMFWQMDHYMIKKGRRNQDMAIYLSENYFIITRIDRINSCISFKHYYHWFQYIELIHVERGRHVWQNKR